MTIWYYLKRALLAALVLALIAVLLFGDTCNKPAPDYTSQYDAIMQERDRLRKDSIVYVHKVTVLLQRIAEQDSVIQSLRAQQAQKEKELSASKTTAQRLRNELEGYRDKDTGYINARFDSLLTEVDNLVWLLDQYITINDQLNKENDSLKISYESLEVQRVQLISDLRNSYNNTINSYQVLYNDYSKLDKKLRNEKVKTKVAAVLALAAGVLAAVK